MDNVIISHINASSPKYAGVWDLREEVLRKPLGMSLKNEDLSDDLVDTIFIAELNNQVIGCLMLHVINEQIFKLRQMAVNIEYQGSGIGRLLVSSAEAYAANAGYARIVLHAREVATGFYHRLGYAITGDQFTEVGVPHFRMEKKLTRR